MATPGINCDRLREENPQWTQRGYATTECWECWYANSDGSVNENGLVDPRTVIDDPGLPAKGAPHPIFPSAIVIDKRVSQVVANWSVIVVVTYRGWGLYHGGPRGLSDGYNRSLLTELPIWQRFTDGTVVGWARKEGIRYPRMVSVRCETRFIGGNAFDAVQAAIVANAGTLWMIGGVQYRFSDQSTASYDGSTYTRANYRFERECALPAIPALSGWGNDNAIPALPALYYWSDRPDTQSSANAPVVSAVPPLAATGGPPNFPALPGFP